MLGGEHAGGVEAVDGADLGLEAAAAGRLLQPGAAVDSAQGLLDDDGVGCMMARALDDVHLREAAAAAVAAVAAEAERAVELANRGGALDALAVQHDQRLGAVGGHDAI